MDIVDEGQTQDEKIYPIPWSIKSVPVVTREFIIRASRREGLTIARWLKMRVAEWENANSSTSLNSSKSSSNVNSSLLLSDADPEIAAIAICSRHIASLDDVAAKRVLSYLQTRWG